jgi:hypothetical protein
MSAFKIVPEVHRAARGVLVVTQILQFDAFLSSGVFLIGLQNAA